MALEGEKDIETQKLFLERLKLRDASNDFHTAICLYLEVAGFDSYSKGVIEAKIDFLTILAKENGVIFADDHSRF